MNIRWKKGDGQGHSDVLTCIRDDGTTTYTRLAAFFPLHDLMHYAVESTLGYKNAFFGLIAQGWGIHDFEEKDPATGKMLRQIPYEADIAERFVGLLQLAESGSLANGPEELCDILTEYCQAQDRIVPEEISGTAVVVIQKRFSELRQQWMNLIPGDSLTLTFP